MNTSEEEHRGENSKTSEYLDNQLDGVRYTIPLQSTTKVATVSDCEADIALKVSLIAINVSILRNTEKRQKDPLFSTLAFDEGTRHKASEKI